MAINNNLRAVYELMLKHQGKARMVSVLNKAHNAYRIRIIAQVPASTGFYTFDLAEYGIERIN